MMIKTVVGKPGVTTPMVPRATQSQPNTINRGRI